MCALAHVYPSVSPQAWWQFLISWPLLVPSGYASDVRQPLRRRPSRCAVPLPPIFPIGSLRRPPALPQVAPADLGSNLWAGAKCYAGINTRDDDTCGMAPIYTNLYILFNLGCESPSVLV